MPVQVVNTAGADSPAPATAEAAPSLSVEERLQRLEKLKADGLISEEEYSAKRQAILGEL
ncbi:MAG TPA: SHOCT domain-containing protein [Polyangiales bacterium]